MGFKEIRVNKSREDQSVDDLASLLIESDISKVSIDSNSVLFEGLQRLIREEFVDIEEACTRHDMMASEFIPENPKEKEQYIQDLSQGAWNHFQEHKLDKFHTAIAELVHESLMFSYVSVQNQCESTEVGRNSARPAISELHQNILRRSILRLNKLPHQLIDGVTGEENNDNLDPIARTVGEIFNHMAFWSYDHVRVFDFLTAAIQPIIEKTGKYDNANRAAKDYATEASEFIWDNIDGAMQIMTFILVEFSILLSTASLNQRHPEYFSRYQIRQTMLSSGDLKERAYAWLERWFNVLTVKLNKPGRPPKDTDVDRELVKEEVIGAMLKILDEPEKISQWRVSRILAIGSYKNRHDRTLYNRLKMLDLTWQDLVKEARHRHRQKRTKN